MPGRVLHPNGRKSIPERSDSRDRGRDDIATSREAKRAAPRSDQTSKSGTLFLLRKNAFNFRLVFRILQLRAISKLAVILRTVYNSNLKGKADRSPRIISPEKLESRSKELIDRNGGGPSAEWRGEKGN